MIAVSVVLFAAAQLQGTPSLSDLLGSTCAPGANCSSTQSGGLSVGTLNVGPRPRSLNDQGRAYLLANTPRDKPITVMAVMGDSEAIQFAQEIQAFLTANGYKMVENGISQGVFSGPVKGLGLRDNGPTRTLIVGANLP